MYPFWETVIEPLIKAFDARRVVEIGALRGEMTSRLLDGLAPDAELHVIDPLPAFDPAEHERRFPGRYVFHRDLSLNVLGDIGPFDVALVDGDHNWYTVYNECRLLGEAASKAGAPLPMLFLHDVLWPYGRRDLYYAPEQIPEEFRQPHAQRGMKLGRKSLLKAGGMNAGLDNAIEEGGPRNGVMTGLEDFMAEHPRPLRRVVLPIYFGLAIVVEEELLDQRPAVRAILDAFESSEGKDRLLELAEEIRLEAARWEQSILQHRDRQLERAATRYLDLLKGALLDEHYLENEVRVEYLLEALQKGRTVDPEFVRDPARFLQRERLRMQQARRAGLGSDAAGTAAFFPYTAMGRARLEHLEEAVQTVRLGGVDGDLVECGTGRGGGAIFLRGLLEAFEMAGRDVFVVDRFLAAPPEGVRPLAEGGAADLWPDLNLVREGFERFDLLDERVRFLQGAFAATLPDAPIERIAVLRIGEGAGADADVILEHLYDRIAVGGVVVVDAGADPGVLAAVTAFRERRGITSPLAHPDSAGVSWRKDVEALATPSTPPPAVAVAPAASGSRVPLAPPAPADAIDLTVVVVAYEMRRELDKTLRSLTRAYQRGIEDLSYEVIVVENGSSAEGRLGEELVSSFGPEFRYVDLGDAATPSPTNALNHGIAIGRGRAFALMIDGAHVLSPGVLRYGMAGLRVHDPAVVLTQQWYVGPGQQPSVVSAGYDQAYEDGLFEQIEWPSDGYRLFEISNFIGERDWLDGMLESNCLFVPRSLLEQVGGFDEGFATAGGGYANLELYERLGASPDVTMVSILGEGSFHQVHGGTTTNVGDAEARRATTFSYGEQYQELRGRLLRGPAKPMHYVGTLATTSARRTRSRRLTAAAFAQTPVHTGPDGIPETPRIIPDELKAAFTEAFWNSLAWQRTTWLGREVRNAPTDLVVYQELLTQVRPDWVIDVGDADGGRPAFFASVCDLLGHGRVVSVGSSGGVERAEHDRLRHVEAATTGDEAEAQVRAIVGEGRALVVIGSRATANRTRRELERFAPLVAVGSYLVVEHTIINGHPVWAGSGPGPTEALLRFLARNGEFVQDTAWEKYGLTFNPGGFLKRVG